MKLHDTIDVLIGGYLSKDAAEEDYNAVLECGGHLQGAAIVSKDLEGNLSVEQTDHMVGEGAEGLGAIGFAVGLIAPPAVLATTAIGAGLIVAYSHTEADKVEPAVTRTIKKAIGEAEGRHVQALKGAIADAQQKMSEQQA